MTDRTPTESHPPTLNALAAPRVAALIARAAQLRVVVETLENGTTLVDGGIDCRGGLEAGRLIAEICLAGLGTVTVVPNRDSGRWPIALQVHTDDPVLACLGSQYAGWSLSHGQGKGAFHALGSGPARVLARKEPLFEELGYRDRADRTCLVLEVDRRPPAALADRIAADCGVAPEALTLIVTPTRSLAGVMQICARVLEVALHKVHELGFPLDRVVDGAGTAPVAPPAPDFVEAMGRTNDSILFAGRVQLYVDGGDTDARSLAESLPSGTSRDYGRPFAEVFKAYDYDFFKIDPMLFSPAQVTVTAVRSGNSFHAGELAPALLERSFGGAE